MRTILSILAVGLLLTPTLLAQEGETVIAGGPYWPTLTGESGLFETMTADPVDKGKWTFGLYHDVSRYSAAPGVLFSIEDPPTTRRPYEDMIVEQARTTASIGYGLTDRWELSLSVPYLVLENQAGDRSGFVNGYEYNGVFKESGTGWARLGTKIGLTNNWAINGFYGFEMESDPSGISTGDVYGGGLIYSRNFFSANLGYEVNDGAGIAVDAIGPFVYDAADRIRADFGIDLELAAWQGARWITEVNTSWYMGASVGPATRSGQPDDSISVSTGLRKAFGSSGWGMSAAVRNNVTAALASSDTKGFGFIVGFHYGPIYYVTLPPPPPAPVMPVSVPMPPTPVKQPEPIATPPAPQEMMKQNIEFDANSARTTNISKAVLDDIALRMQEEPASTLVITGYATELELKNDEGVARRRAESTRDFLISRHKIDDARIDVVDGGVGEKTVVMELVVR